jgi:hypothetical protein
MAPHCAAKFGFLQADHIHHKLPTLHLEGETEDRLLGSTAKSHQCATAAKPNDNDLWWWFPWRRFRRWRFPTAVAFVVAVLVAISVQCEVDTRSPKVELACGVAANGVAIGGVTMTGSLMMSSSATSAFRGGGAGVIRTAITVTTITRTITMGTAGTLTTVTQVMVMDTAMAGDPVMDTAIGADQGICRVCGGSDKRGLRLLLNPSSLGITADSLQAEEVCRRD